MSLQQTESDDYRDARQRSEESFAHALTPSVRSKLLAMQTDSFYVVKRWSQVETNLDLQHFREKVGLEPPKPPTTLFDANLRAKFLWSVLHPEAWRELPWRSPGPATVRDVHRDLQEILTTQSYKVRRMLKVNRQLLEAYFPGTIEPAHSKTFSYIVLEHDQKTRWNWFCWSLTCFVLVGLFFDLNFTSLHGFYADRIGGTWINPAAGIGPEIPLAQLRTVEKGLPYHLISGSLNPFEDRTGAHSKTDLFLLSQLFSGSEVTGYRSTSELADRNYNLASAIAISGGAVNPVQFQNPVQRVMLFLFNIRLGQWIENPGFQGNSWRIGEWLGRNLIISPFRFFLSRLRPLKKRMYCFVTDGGLTDNSGICQLLRRRCKIILAVDAGQDGRFQFHDLSKLLRWVQVDYGIRIEWQDIDSDRAEKFNLQPVSLSPVMPTFAGEVAEKNKGASPSQLSADPYARPLNADAQQHFLIGKIIYPEDQEQKNEPSYLIYMKATVCAKDPTELVNYQKANPLFPHDPTTDLNFTPDQFESYRHLGEQTVTSTLKAIFPDLRQDVIDRASLYEAINQQFNGSSCQQHLVVSKAELDEWKRTILEPGEFFARRAAVTEISDFDDARDEVLKALVGQLDSADTESKSEIAELLERFDVPALNPLFDRLDQLNESQLYTRLAVIERFRIPRNSRYATALRRLLNRKLPADMRSLAKNILSPDHHQQELPT